MFNRIASTISAVAVCATAFCQTPAVLEDIKNKTTMPVVLTPIKSVPNFLGDKTLSINSYAIVGEDLSTQKAIAGGTVGIQKQFAFGFSGFLGCAIYNESTEKSRTALCAFLSWSK